MYISDVRSDKIEKTPLTVFNIISGFQDVRIQSGETCDMEVAILICK